MKTNALRRQQHQLLRVTSCLVLVLVVVVLGAATPLPPPHSNAPIPPETSTATSFFSRRRRRPLKLAPILKRQQLEQQPLMHEQLQKEQTLLTTRPWQHTTTTTSSSNQTEKRQSSSSSSFSSSSLPFAFKMGLSGGLGGAVGTLLLFPMDTAKTLRQASPSQYTSVSHALQSLFYSNQQWHLQRAYSGWVSSSLGAIPSSALYFGTYESVKQYLTQRLRQHQKQQDHHSYDTPLSVSQRCSIHSLSAISGNIVSSSIFVPKELIKQRMQYTGHALLPTLASLWKEQPLGQGFYKGWTTTLMRNVPSAVLRFTLYEEIKRVVYSQQQDNNRPYNTRRRRQQQQHLSLQLFFAGALAGALASGFMTPIDVLKTRVSTGTCPVDVPTCIQMVVEEQGWKGLYAGAGSRKAFSGLFSAIGFGTFEAAKSWLGVAESSNMSGGVGGDKKEKVEEKERTNRAVVVSKGRVEQSRQMQTRAMANRRVER
jgi:solute carrier family 25 S-adenosylmethionine transporter 26